MDKSDIVALAKAGFTVEQIAALAQMPDAPAAPAAPATPAAPAAPAALATPAAPAAPATPAAPAAPDWGAAILEKLGALTTAIQTSAIMATSQPREMTADDVIASIIAPPNIGADNNP